MQWSGSFFEGQVPEERRAPPPRPPWMPPEEELPAAVPLRLVLARTDKAVAAIAEASVYSNGFDLRLTLLTREQDMLMGGAVMHPRPVHGRWRSA